MPSTDDAELLAALRRGDADAFAQLVDDHSSALLRAAMTYVPTRAVAEEVVQETWLGAFQGLDRFEGRASVKTWLYSILANIARSRGARERRSQPFSSFAAAADEYASSVDPDRFLPAEHARWPGHWSTPPAAVTAPEDDVLARETLDVIRAAVEGLPEAQRTVISLRDLEGWDADEVCDALGVSDGNQRVLLHRARSKVRAALERHEAAPGITG